MATKKYYATGSFKYQTRMMQAGDPVELDGPTARLFTALNKISPNAPKPARAAASADTNTLSVNGGPVAKATVAAKPKRAPRKRAAKKSK